MNEASASSIPLTKGRSNNIKTVCGADHHFHTGTDSNTNILSVPEYYMSSDIWNAHVEANQSVARNGVAMILMTPEN